MEEREGERSQMNVGNLKRKLKTLYMYNVVEDEQKVKDLAKKGKKYI